MFESWKIGVLIQANSNVARIMGEATKATLMTNNAIGKHGEVLKKAAAQQLAYREQIQKTQAVSRVASAGFSALALVTGAAIYTGIKGAADLETAMTGIAIATHATRQQMEMLRNVAFDISASTAQSVVDSANVMQIMASSGINNANQLAAIAKPAALFADVQFLKSRGQTSFDDAARQAIQIAHLFQAYTPAKITPILNQLSQLSFMMPDNLNRFLTQAGYYMPVFRRLGVRDNDSLALGAFLDRMGLGRGKGGTGLQQFALHLMGSLQNTAHQQKGVHGALQALGLLNSDGSAKNYRNGQLDVIGALTQINETITKQTEHLKGHAKDVALQQAIINIQRGLGIQGGRIGFLGTPEALQQLGLMVQTMRRLDPNFMVKSQATYMDTLNARFQQFRTNFSSLLTELMWPFLANFKGVFKFMADKLHDWQQWLHAHKGSERLIGDALFASFGAAIVGVGLTSVVAADRILILNAAIARLALGGSLGAGEGAAGAALSGLRVPMIAAAFRGLLAVITGPVGVVLAISAVAMGAYKLARDWYPLNRRISDMSDALAGMNGSLGDFGRGLRNVLTSINILHDKTSIIDPKTGLPYTFGGRHAVVGPTAGDPGGQHNLRGKIMHAIFGADPSMWDDTAPPAHRSKMDRRVHIDTVNINLPKGTPKEHAKKIVDHLLDGAVGGSRAGVAVHPRHSRLQFGRAI